jgi:hypothetical protein
MCWWRAIPDVATIDWEVVESWVGLLGGTVHGGAQLTMTQMCWPQPAGMCELAMIPTTCIACKPTHNAAKDEAHHRRSGHSSAVLRSSSATQTVVCVHAVHQSLKLGFEVCTGANVLCLLSGCRHSKKWPLGMQVLM